jgi:hypothetical protein
MGQLRFVQDGVGKVQEDDLARPTSMTGAQHIGSTACLQSLAEVHALAVVAMAPLESTQEPLEVLTPVLAVEPQALPSPGAKQMRSEIKYRRMPAARSNSWTKADAPGQVARRHAIPQNSDYHC